MVEKNIPTETKENMPKFLMVKFNEKGQPIGANPMKDPSNLPKFINVKIGENGDEKGLIYSFVEPTSPSILTHNKELIRKMLMFVVKNNENLREEIRQSSYLLEQEIENIEKRSNFQDASNQKIKDKLSELSIILVDLTTKMNQIKSVNLLDEKLENINLKFSNLTKEMAGTKTHELEIVQILRSFLEKISILNQEIQYQNTEFYENQKQLKENILIDQEKFYKTITTEVSKIKKMLKRPKKRQAKPQKAKVIRFLKEKFNIEPFTKVLVITDKRNSTFGNILYESLRKLSENSIFVVTENRKGEAILDNSVVEAIKQSNYAFIVGKHSKTQMIEISGMMLNQVKIIAIKRSLKYSLF